MSLQILSDIMNQRLNKEIKNNRPEKGGDLPASGGFPAPPAPEPRAAHFSPSHPRRAVADRTACLHQRFPKFPWRLRSIRDSFYGFPRGNTLGLIFVGYFKESRD